MCVALSFPRCESLEGSSEATGASHTKGMTQYVADPVTLLPVEATKIVDSFVSMSMNQRRQVRMHNREDDGQ
jgi:hypothetical protein